MRFTYIIILITSSFEVPSVVDVTSKLHHKWFSSHKNTEYSWIMVNNTSKGADAYPPPRIEPQVPSVVDVTSKLHHKWFSSHKNTEYSWILVNNTSKNAAAPSPPPPGIEPQHQTFRFWSISMNFVSVWEGFWIPPPGAKKCIFDSRIKMGSKPTPCRRFL